MRTLKSYDFPNRTRDRWGKVLDGKIHELVPGEDFPKEWDTRRLVRNLRASGRSRGVSVDWDEKDEGKVVVQARPIRSRNGSKKSSG